MNAEGMRKLIAYHHWANRRVAACIDKLSEEEFKRDLGYSLGSVYNIVFHVMSGELFFLEHFEAGAVTEMQALKQEDFPTWDSIRTRWETYRARVDAAFATLTDEELLVVDVLPGDGPDAPKFPLWEPFLATVDHATDHRAQILALIGQMGGETCEHQYWFFMFEK